ncbi:hypothetical protein AB0N17_41245 [Streptomyces sp. NPDC051133]|uniref:hypothetical protein n=1 Tax=Streptomyces sp. NPDC051133 TaxID=3155521 RepID=UPI0034369F07
MRLRKLLIGAWPWLNYKPAMADTNRPGHHAFPELNTSGRPAKSCAGSAPKRRAGRLVG